MTASPSTYTVGRGRPPLHTRFQKGQSGNPSGKPGPAKLAKQRFLRALYAALQDSPEDLELSKPQNVIAALARKMMPPNGSSPEQSCFPCCREQSRETEMVCWRKFCLRPRTLKQILIAARSTSTNQSRPLLSETKQLLLPWCRVKRREATEIWRSKSARL